MNYTVYANDKWKNKFENEDPRNAEATLDSFQLKRLEETKTQKKIILQETIAKLLTQRKTGTCFQILITNNLLATILVIFSRIMAYKLKKTIRNTITFVSA